MHLLHARSCRRADYPRCDHQRARVAEPADRSDELNDACCSCPASEAGSATVEQCTKRLTVPVRLGVRGDHCHEQVQALADAYRFVDV